ncbi:MAG: type I-E CRISPR-associated protein Cas6/Cse3/CasE [Myxococcales bacterium]|nr:type I-E CRISPR-associated protein Cas6/Cse3/CasE [Myxococcales bacterium]
MYLSTLLLNLKLPRVRRDLSSCSAMHSRVLSGFGLPEKDDPGAEKPTQTLRERLDVLYRVDWTDENQPVLVVQSTDKPDWSTLPQGYLAPMGDNGTNIVIQDLTSQLDAIELHTSIPFRLRANPTRKVPSGLRPGRVSKHPAREFLKTEMDRFQWLQRQAENAGFSLKRNELDEWMVVEHQDGWQRGFSKNDHGEHQQVQQKGVVYEGILQVEDKERFIVAIRKGIGPGKSYGFGLLTLRL